MSIVLVAIILVGAVLLVCLPLIIIDKRAKSKSMNRKLLLLSELGSSHQLSFSAQEILAGSILALDGINRKLFILHNTPDNKFEETLVNLDEIKYCTVKKHYGTIKAGELPSRKLSEYLSRIVLHFEFKDGIPSLEVVFYDHIQNGLGEMEYLEEKARRWEVVLSSMLLTKSRKIA
jgi:hypothetical protein